MLHLHLQKNPCYLMLAAPQISVMYYRRDVFALAGLPPPSTWEELIFMAQKLNGSDFNGGVTKREGPCKLLAGRDPHTWLTALHPKPAPLVSALLEHTSGLFHILLKCRRGGGLRGVHASQPVP
jgi:hypothetical protein